MSDLKETPIQIENNFDIHELLASDIPTYYANQFVFVRGNADCMILLQHNSRFVAKINMPLPLLKTLNAIADNAIQEMEDKTGQKVLSTLEIDKHLGKQ